MKDESTRDEAIQLVDEATTLLEQVVMLLGGDIDDGAEDDIVWQLERAMTFAQQALRKLQRRDA